MQTNSGWKGRVATMRRQDVEQILDFWGFEVKEFPGGYEISFETPFYNINIHTKVGHNINTKAFVDALADYAESFDPQEVAVLYWNELEDTDGLDLVELVSDLEAFESYLIAAVRDLREEYKKYE